LKDIFGMKPGGKKRGPAMYYRRLYEKSLLGGKIVCGDCQKVLLVAARSREKAVGCPAHRNGECPMGLRIPFYRAEKAVLDVIAEVLRSYPSWLQQVADELRRALQQHASSMPDAVARVELELGDVCSQLARLIDAVAEGKLEGPTVREKVATLEQRKVALQAELAQSRKTHAAPMQMPDDAWIAAELKDLAGLLQQEMATVAPILRPMVGKVVGEQIKPKGTSMGYPRIRFTLDGFEMLRQVLVKKLPASVLEGMGETICGFSPEFTADLGRGMATEKWAPRMEQWRQDGLTWDEIGKRTGLKPSTAHLAHKRWRERNAKPL
jgi:hypothetical protein